MGARSKGRKRKEGEDELILIKNGEIVTEGERTEIMADVFTIMLDVAARYELRPIDLIRLWATALYIRGIGLKERDLRQYMDGESEEVTDDPQERNREGMGSSDTKKVINLSDRKAAYRKSGK